MAKPSNVLGWLSDPNFADTDYAVEPSSGRKTVGWGKGERPSAQITNHKFGVISRWIDYLNSEEQPSRTILISPVAFVPGPGTTWDLNSSGTERGGNGTLFAGIDVKVGERITEVRVYARYPGAGVVNAAITQTSAAGLADLRTASVASGGAADVTLTMGTGGSLPHVVLAGFAYRVEVGATSGTAKLYTCEVDIDRPGA